VDVSMSTFEFEDWGIRTEGWSGSDLEVLMKNVMDELF